MQDMLKDMKELLTTILNLKLIEPNALIIKYILNFLKLCQGLPILADKF